MAATWKRRRGLAVSLLLLLVGLQLVAAGGQRQLRNLHKHGRDRGRLHEGGGGGGGVRRGANAGGAGPGGADAQRTQEPAVKPAHRQWSDVLLPIPPNTLATKTCRMDFLPADGNPFDRDACVPVDPCVVLYNRVPKTGSTSLHQGMDILVRHANYTLLNGFGWREYRPDITEAYNRLARTVRPGFRVLAHPHVFFVEEFATASNPRMAFVNLIRHPVNRFLSSFYFEIARGRVEEQDQDIQRFLSMHIDPPAAAKVHSKTTYVLEDPPDTLEVLREHLHNFATKWFCGRKPVCSTNSRQALDIAKRNIHDHYITVGTLDQMDDLLRVLGKKIPAYFQDLYQVTHGRRKNSNSRRPRHVPAPVVRKIQKLNKLDLELFEYVQDLFERQKAACLPIDAHHRGGVDVDDLAQPPVPAAEP